MNEPEPTAVERAARAKKLRRIAMVVGVLLALVCKSLPPDYQGACEIAISACRGGF